MSRPSPVHTVADWVGPVLFIHAHPDDETIATGALIAELVAGGFQVDLVTASRGERGEVVEGSTTAAEGSPELAEHREAEITQALAVLGVSRRCYLGTLPARAQGQERRYLDSGMRWVRPGLAGPAEDSGPQALTSAALAEAVADLCAVIEAWRPARLVSYDEGGGYGHPDHVRVYEIVRAAAEQTGVAFTEVVTEPDLGVSLDLSAHLDQVRRALLAHRSQVTVDGSDIVHVGGQREPIPTRIELREAK